jgi:ribulose-phosphate 3-epimerase
MVEAIRRSCDSFKTEERASLELHMCVDRPSRYVRPMADVGADAFIFQLEAMESFEEASILAGSIVEAGMRCGVSIDPKTNVEKLYPVLETGLVDVVDVLAVEPGFGGQHFQEHVLQKIKALWEWRDARGLSFDIMVDGGVNDNTARRIVDAGADVLVAGTFLFNHPEGLARGVLELLPNTAIL